jgi:hypothetical protein
VIASTRRNHRVYPSTCNLNFAHVGQERQLVERLGGYEGPVDWSADQSSLH